MSMIHIGMLAVQITMFGERLKRRIYIGAEEIFKFIAKIFNYPNTPGMPMIPEESFPWSDYVGLKQRKFELDTSDARNLIELVIGGLPDLHLLERKPFPSGLESYYSFHVSPYRTNVYIPDWASEILQLHLNLHLDLTELELARLIIFHILITYQSLIYFRLTLSWFLSFNPYTQPFIWITSLVDTFEEIGMKWMPVIGGMAPIGVYLSLIVGRIADLLNHLIFTMPYLPSEGHLVYFVWKRTKFKVWGFTGVPQLWKKYPIPNDLREYWYTDRPDILKQLQRSFKGEDVQLLPDRIITQITDKATTEPFQIDNSYISKIIYFFQEIVYNPPEIGDLDIPMRTYYFKMTIYYFCKTIYIILTSLKIIFDYYYHLFF